MKWQECCCGLIGVYCGWAVGLCAQPATPEPGLDVPPEPAKPITLDVPAWRDKLSAIGGPLWLQHLPNVRITVEAPAHPSDWRAIPAADWLKGMEFVSPFEGIWFGYRFPETRRDGRPAATLSIQYEF